MAGGVPLDTDGILQTVVNEARREREAIQSKVCRQVLAPEVYAIEVGRMRALSWLVERVEQLCRLAEEADDVDDEEEAGDGNRR